MKTIALINQKGGVGKTTTTINLGAALSMQGKKVALVDLDPQANLTYSLGVQAHELKNTVYELMTGKAEVADVLISRDGIDLVPSTLDLSGAEIEFVSTKGRESIIKNALAELSGYDYILIDCPPSLGVLSINALNAAQEVYIPLQAEFLALQGVSKLMETIEKINTRLNSPTEMTGIILTLFDTRKTLNQEVAQKINEHFGKKVFKTFIRNNVALAEAPSFGQTIFEYKPSSNGANDYMALCKEMVKRS